MDHHRSRNRALLRLVFIAAFAGITSTSINYSFADETDLLIAIDEEPTGFENRIRAELLSLGYEVTMVPVDPAMAPNEMLETIAADASASAAIRIVSLPDKVDIWVADRITGKILNRQIEVSGDSAESQAVVSFAAIDLLRASLLELDMYRKEAALKDRSAQNQTDEPKQDRVIQKEVQIPPREERLVLGLAPALAMGALGPSPGFDVLLDTHITATRFLSVGLLGFIPLVSSKFESPVGDGEASIGFVGVDARFTLHLGSGRWRLNLTPGFGVLLVKLVGQAINENYESHSELAVAAAPILRGGVSFLVVDPLSIRLDALGGLSLRAIDVEMGQETEARFGRPILALSIGVDLRVW